MALVPRGIETDACMSFLSLCDVLDGLQLCARRDGIRAETLHRMCVRHMELFLVAHGPDKCIPKSHIVMHLPKMFAAHGVLVSCFTHERKHKMVKRYAQPVCDTSKAYERAIMAEITQHHFMTLELTDTFATGTHLVEPRAASANVNDVMSALAPLGRDARMSKIAAFPGGICKVGDAVCFEVGGALRAGEIWFHAQVVRLGDESPTCVTAIGEWTQLHADEPRTRSRRTALPIVVCTQCIKDVLIFAGDADIVVALVPPSLRDFP